MLQLHKWHLSSIRVLSSCGRCAPLIKVTSLKPSLSTIGKVHITLHMFVLEPAPEKKSIWCFYWQRQHVLFRGGRTVMDAWSEGGKGDKKKQIKLKWDWDGVKQRGKQVWGGVIFKQKRSGGHCHEWRSFGWRGNALHTSDPPHYSHWARSLLEVERRSAVSSHTTIPLCLTKGRQILKHTRKAPSDICPK